MFGSVAILSILICMLNIKITEILGRPFTYQWLYYSDFLNSTDASRAVTANIEKRSLAAYLLMILAAVPLAWLIYQALIKKPVLVLVILIMCFGIGYFAKNDVAINDEKKENPVTYFISSLIQNSLLLNSFLRRRTPSSCVANRLESSDCHSTAFCERSRISKTESVALS